MLTPRAKGVPLNHSRKIHDDIEESSPLTSPKSYNDYFGEVSPLTPRAASTKRPREELGVEEEQEIFCSPPAKRVKAVEQSNINDNCKENDRQRLSPDSDSFLSFDEFD